MKSKKASSFEDLETREGDDFETLNAKIASGLMEVIHGEFLRQMNVLEEKYAQEGKMINGRQIAFKIYNHFRISEQEGAVDGSSPEAESGFHPGAAGGKCLVP